MKIYYREFVDLQLTKVSLSALLTTKLFNFACHVQELQEVDEKGNVKQHQPTGTLDSIKCAPQGIVVTDSLAAVLPNRFMESV